MSCYSVVKVGSDYIVKVKEQGVLKLSSRRMAFRLLVQVIEREAEAESESEHEPLDTSACAEDDGFTCPRIVRVIG